MRSLVKGSPAFIGGRRAESSSSSSSRPFLVEREEAGEANDLAGRAEVEFARPRLGEDVDRGALEFGALHLAGDRAVPDQLVELGLLGLEMPGDVLRPARRGRSAGSPRGLPARSWP